MRQDPKNDWEQLEHPEKLNSPSEFYSGVISSFPCLIIGFFFERLGEFPYVLLESTVFMGFAVIGFIAVLISVYYCFRYFRPQIEKIHNGFLFPYRDTDHAFPELDDYTVKIIEIFGRQEKFYRQLTVQFHAENKLIDKNMQSVHSTVDYFANRITLILVNGNSLLQQLFIRISV